MKITAAVTYEKGSDFVLKEAELDDPKDNEVLIRMVGVGVCHTDALARDQFMPVPLPAVLGHEGSGIIEKTGSHVKHLKPGDHVVVSFSSCGVCEQCLEGRPFICERDGIPFRGTYADGTKRLSCEGQELSCFFGQSTFATYAIADERNCAKIDSSVDLSIMGPMGCGIQHGAGAVMNSLRPEAGTSLVIFGTGAVGMSALLAAVIVGCSKIICVDIVDSRLELALELGATHAIHGKRTKDVVGEIRRITNGGANYAIDTSAVPDLINQALLSLRPRGTCALLASTGMKMVPLFLKDGILLPEKRLIGVIEGDSIPQIFIPKLVGLYNEGKFPFDKLVKKYPFEKINEAFEDSHSGKTIKPVLCF